jgi:hypothetical protein
MLSRPQDTFDDHAWILSKLLTETKLSGEASILQQYVTAACFPKMLHRLNSDISKLFFDSLTSLSHFEPPKLLETIPQSGSDTLLLETLQPLFGKLLKTSAPNLQQACNAAHAGEPCKAYTKKTCIEFHKVLCELLEGFRTSLVTLSSGSNYSQHLHSAIFYGEALHQLARSDAVMAHLEAVRHLLADHCRGQTADVLVDDDQTADESVDDALLALCEKDNVLPVWRSYLDWLKLMVVHFDAVAILHNYVTGGEFPFSEISIQILTSPPTKMEMLSWKELLEREEFPSTLIARLECCGYLHNDNTHHITNAVSKVTTDIRALLDPNYPVDSTTAIDKILNQLQQIMKSKLPFLRVNATAIASKIATLKDDYKSSEARDLIADVLGTLGTMHKNMFLFSQLKKDPLSKGCSSGLSTHCEANLASLIYLARTVTSGPMYEKYKDVLNELSVSLVVSKCYIGS